MSDIEDESNKKAAFNWFFPARICFALFRAFSEDWRCVSAAVLAAVALVSKV